MPTVYRCMVWFTNGSTIAEPSLAYGQFKEHDDLTDAMTDLTVLKMTSMKSSNPAGNFYANVMGYPKGHPPRTMRREVYLELGGE